MEPEDNHSLILWRGGGLWATSITEHIHSLPIFMLRTRDLDVVDSLRSQIHKYNRGQSETAVWTPSGKSISPEDET